MEQFKPAEIKSQRQYEKGVVAIITPSVKEKIIDFLRTVELSSFKNKKISKEDIIRIDAQIELEALKASEGKEKDSPEQKKLERIKNSDLSFKKEDYGYGFEDNIVRGKINKQDVDVHHNYQDIPNGDRIKESYRGTFNGKQLSEEAAKNIFDEYNEIAKERMNAIIKFISEEAVTKNPEVTYKIGAGMDLRSAAVEMIALVKKVNADVVAEFNDVKIRANEDSTADEIVSFYDGHFKKGSK